MILIINNYSYDNLSKIVSYNNNQLHVYIGNNNVYFYIRDVLGNITGLYLLFSKRFYKKTKRKGFSTLKPIYMVGFFILLLVLQLGNLQA
jgi:hypothetical protein